MSKLNDVIGETGIPEYVRKEFSECLFCFQEISEGGSWTGKRNIGVCVNCCGSLIDLLIDTLEDADGEYKTLDSDQRLERLLKITKERFSRKENKKSKCEAITSMKKVGLKYYSEIGIIDFFGLSMSPDELKMKVDPRNNEMDYFEFDINDVDVCVEKIEQIIYSETREKPHTIRFFSIPNFTYGRFDIGCVAKINNNGSTYLFTNNENYIERYESYADIKSIF